MAAIGKALIVGGGIAGMCAAIQLRKLGVHVDLVEIDPNWRVYGAGITLSGPTLRAFHEIGVIDAIMEQGWCADGVDICLADGRKIAELPTPRIGRPDVPGGGGILRPVLAGILRNATLASGASVRCGTTVLSLEADGDAVQVSFTDGRESRYELIIAADGLQSQLRGTLFPDAPKPSYTGQSSWRAVVPRPAALTRPVFFMGADIKAGVNPVSRDEMYLFVTEPRPAPEHIEESRWAETLRDLLTPFDGSALVSAIRDGLDERARIVYRPFFALLVPPPWHRGKVVLIGDAAHATTPHLASGAGIGVEDAIVLAQELARMVSVEEALQAFTARRFERCRMVVENSLTLGDLERTGAPKTEHEQLMRDSMAKLLMPI